MKTKKLIFLIAVIVWIAVGCTAYSDMDNSRSDELVEANNPIAEVAQAWEYPHIIGLINKEPVDLYEQYFGADAPIIRAVCKAENGAEDPNAVYKNNNGSIDQGLCQINSIHADKYAGEDIFDPEVNIKTAKKVYDSQGWYAWVMWKNNKWKEFYDN